MADFYSAKHYAKKAQKWATGTMAECPDGSAKHWAQVAEATAESVKTGLPEQSTATYGKFLQSGEEGAKWASNTMPEIIYWEG